MDPAAATCWSPFIQVLKGEQKGKARGWEPSHPTFPSNPFWMSLQETDEQVEAVRQLCYR